MESQKIINLLEHSDDGESKFQTKKWYVINDQNKCQYGKGDQNNSTIKFSTEIVKPFLGDYADTYILVTGDITVAGGDDNTKVAFKNCHPFIRAVIHLNDEHVGTAENLDVIMNMYNLIEYSDNYSDSTTSLYQFKRQEQDLNNAGEIQNINDDSASFKYKSKLLGTSTPVNAADDSNNHLAHRLCKGVQMIVPLRYIRANIY